MKQQPNSNPNSLDPSTQPSIEEKKEVSLPESVTVEEYAVSEPQVDVSDSSGEYEKRIDIEYSFTGEEVAVALKVFQKKMIFKKNLIYTVVLLFLEVLYLQALIKDPDYFAGKLMACLCVIVIAFLWYMPWQHIRRVAKATDSIDQSYHIAVTEKGFVTKNDEKEYLIDYRAERTSVVETADLFVVAISKERCFAIPKRYIDPSKLDEVRELMKAGLKEKYQVAKEK